MGVYDIGFLENSERRWVGGGFLIFGNVDIYGIGVSFFINFMWNLVIFICGVLVIGMWFYIVCVYG